MVNTSARVGGMNTTECHNSIMVTRKSISSLFLSTNRNKLARWIITEIIEGDLKCSTIDFSQKEMKQTRLIRSGFIRHENYQLVLLVQAQNNTNDEI